MITCVDIVGALHTLIVEQIPEFEGVYIEYMPEVFNRPCLLIQAVTSSMLPSNCGLVEVTANFKLTIFDSPYDDSYTPMGGVLSLQDKLLGLFRKGHIFVPDGSKKPRAPKVQAGIGDREEGNAFVNLQVVFLDARDETLDTTPLMESIETKTQLKG
ncbi:hypothetical protein U6B65_12855 [Oscillospiraceae bacterium MB08-C2-2]|nr:hypothetical protein U6B65_12855 [Oscillospiraceae bacterium MB08-C2-2]